MSSENSTLNEQHGSDNVNIKKANPLTGWLPPIVIVASLILSYYIFFNVFGAPENFQGGPEAADKYELWVEAKAEWEEENADLIKQYEEAKAKHDEELAQWKEEFKQWKRDNRKKIQKWEENQEEYKAELAEWQKAKKEWEEQNDSILTNWDTAQGPKPTFEKEQAKPEEPADKPTFDKKKPELNMDEQVFPQPEPPQHTDLDPVPPKKGQIVRGYFGVAYKGGFVIPIGMALTLCIIIFSIERAISIGRASGRGSIDVFVKKVRMKLSDADIDGALDECDRQKGSVANVIRAGLKKYKEVENNQQMDKDQKKLAIQGELEEATNLELPSLERNLSIIATIVSIGVLVGLFGTVLGMIRAFAALSASGAPDASELATGISEALVNTAVGIFNSMAALVMYNYFTGKIDKLTYSIDEAGYSIIQTYDVEHKD